MRRALLASTLVTTLLTGGGCGENGSFPAATAPDLSTFGYPVTVGKLTLDRRPERIVSLVPSATEMLFAIDAGRQVVAVDEDSNYPTNAPKTSLSGLEPDITAIAAMNPDLVVISDDLGPATALLGRLGIPVLLTPPASTLNDTYRQIGQLGTLTGHEPEAEALHRQMAGQIAQVAEGVLPRSRPLTYYYELDPTLYTVTSRTFVGSIFKMLGLTSVADHVGPRGGGYPQLSPAALIRSDPDTIFLADSTCCRQSAGTVAARRGWNAISAVRTGRIYPLDDDIASTWGPRTVDLVRAVAAAARG
ncbi:MAG TPA: ABC transporter substrate-binding protein [Actinoplanes sp.]